MEPVCNFSQCSMGNELWRIAIIVNGHLCNKASASCNIISPVKILKGLKHWDRKHGKHLIKKNENGNKCNLILFGVSLHSHSCTPLTVNFLPTLVLDTWLIKIFVNGVLNLLKKNHFLLWIILCWKINPTISQLNNSGIKCYQPNKTKNRFSELLVML